ncbi:DUF1206 domain-containing protein [Aeromicrobium duanguangcaii]|uniref:DUF1206 domain-containing protein n=1 Tax=Aeromicrobium duanguangcaii TaxID=2968086 RepID=UPI0020177313|nr:DUF1206 domain-containing protein [Aeromicrobium duanguangcaii]MCL3837150.1 DUF1206 domain-containing protein [Aeromicrobium duanguangcaii]
MTPGSAPSAARAVDNHPAMDYVARAGLVAFGVVHVVMGWLTLQLAFGDRENKADSSGAVQELAEQPFGGAIVWAVAIGMILLAAWQAIEAAVGHREDDNPKRLRKRLTSLGKVAVYLAIAISAIKVVTGSGSSKKDGTTPVSVKLMDLPMGQFIVGVVALGIAAVGVYLIYKGATQRFLKDIEAGGTSGRVGTAYVWLGTCGYVAKGAAIVGVGALFGYAAITHEPKKSGGIDEALLTLLEQPFGPFVTALVGAGFVAFGLFCFAWARHIDR